MISNIKIKKIIYFIYFSSFFFPLFFFSFFSFYVFSLYSQICFLSLLGALKMQQVILPSALLRNAGFGRSFSCIMLEKVQNFEMYYSWNTVYTITQNMKILVVWQVSNKCSPIPTKSCFQTRPAQLAPSQNQLNICKIFSSLISLQTHKNK